MSGYWITDDGKIHIPARKRMTVRDQQVIRVSADAYNLLVEIYNECNGTLCIKDIASACILASANKIEFERSK